jgi:hypothetical protein
METKLKELYEAPAITIVEVKQEGVLCGSVKVTLNDPMGDGSEDEWFF